MQGNVVLMAFANFLRSMTGPFEGPKVSSRPHRAASGVSCTSEVNLDTSRKQLERRMHSRRTKVFVIHEQRIEREKLGVPKGGGGLHKRYGAGTSSHNAENLERTSLHHRTLRSHARQVQAFSAPNRKQFCSSVVLCPVPRFLTCRSLPRASTCS